MRILVVGGGGFLGGEVVSQAVDAGHETHATFSSRPGEQAGVSSWRQVDIRERDETAAAVASVNPDVVVNAAYRKPDWAVTADGAVNVLLAASGLGAHLVFVSSDTVFSGAAERYDEDARPDPITPYGAAKAAAETAIRAVDPSAAIVRTSLILGGIRSHHEAFIHDLAAGRRQGVLFTDDVRCPVHVTDLASVLLELAVAGAAGIHHAAGPDPVSRYELGCLIARRDGIDPASLPIGSRAETGIPGPTALHLDCARTQAILQTRLRGVREFVGE